MLTLVTGSSFAMFFIETFLRNIVYHRQFGIPPTNNPTGLHFLVIYEFSNLRVIFCNFADSTITWLEIHEQLVFFGKYAEDCGYRRQFADGISARRPLAAVLAAAIRR